MLRWPAFLTASIDIFFQALNERLKQTDDVDWPSSSDEDENAETAESTENNV